MNKLMIFVIVIFGARAHGQVNLVPNPSFELYDTCPMYQGLVPYATGWENWGNSPDYFNSCSGNYEFSVPLNWGGYQDAADGNAYCAIGTYALYYPNLREFIAGQLTTPTQVGTKYYVSFKVCLSISDYIQSYSATNNLGVLFSTVTYSWMSPPALNNFAHVNSSAIITDTTNWTTVFGSFIADSSYDYIMIGNFFDDLNTDTIIYIDTAYNFAYYYVDEICVSTDSAFAWNYTTGIGEQSNDESVLVYPNPTSDLATLAVDGNNEHHEFVLQNSMGQVVLSSTFYGATYTFDTGSLSSGVYLIQVVSGDRKRSTQKLVVNHE